MLFRWITGIILIAAGVMSFIYSAVIMGVHSGSKFYLIWILIGLLLTGLGICIPFKVLTRLKLWVKLTAAGVIFTGAVVFIIILVSILKVYNCETVNNLDYLIVPGAQVKPDGPSVVLDFRIKAAAAYLKDNPNTTAIVSGAQGANEPVSEAAAMKEYLMAYGIDASRIVLEDRATNTCENIKYSFEIIEENSAGSSGRDKSIGIVTNNFHMRRSLFLAKRLGRDDVYAVSAKSLRLYEPNNVLREILALIKDFFFSR